MLNDTFTQVSNPFLENIISNTSFCIRSRVLNFILRMTAGYHRDSVKLSRSEIAEAVGYKGALPNISRCLTWLKVNGFISKKGKSITLLKQQSTSESQKVSNDAQKKVSPEAFQNVSNDAQIESYPQAKDRINNDSIDNKKSINIDIKNTQNVSIEIPTIKEILNKKLTTREIENHIKFCSEQGEQFDADKIKHEYKKFAYHNEDNPKINSPEAATAMFDRWLSQAIRYIKKGRMMNINKKSINNETPEQPGSKNVSTHARFFDTPQPVQQNVSPDAQNVSDNRHFVSSNAARIASDFAEFIK